MSQPLADTPSCGVKGKGHRRSVCSENREEMLISAMIKDEPFPPRQYPGVMFSSTFQDLEQHRAKLINAIWVQKLHPVAMEQDAALPTGTVIDSSLA
jgi:hypothetical protein